jgi:hypothetical protein
MSHSFPDNIVDSPKLTNDEVAELVRQQMPRFQVACDHADADTVIFSQMAFGSSEEELFLMGVAVRYAGIVGKTVTIFPHPEAPKVS